MSVSESPDPEAGQASHRPSPLLRLRCDGCSYGASVRKTPEQCPMCGGSAWIVEGWRHWGDLTRDLDPVADVALTRDNESSSVFPGVPLT
jgi:hypothetical protein